MSSLLEYVRLAARERGFRPMLPPSHIDPNEPDTATPHQPARPTATEEKRVWRQGQDAMTYNAWLANEKELDDAFRIWRDTDDGKREVAEVYSRFPGLRLTSMGAEDVSWFVREMSTPEEGLLTTERYMLNQPLYWDTPPYIPSSRIYPGTTAKGIADMPAEVLDKIFKRVGLFGGPIIMALKDQSSAHAPSRFHATFALPTHRINIDRCMNVWAISTSMREDRYNLADFKIRFNLILTDGVVQPFEGSDEIGFDYEEEVVHLGASRNTGRMIFGTDAPCDRTFVKKWINSQLFLDDGGHLAVRAFRLKFDPGTHARELSKRWLSDIFQHLHRRGIRGISAGSNTLLLDWNARDL
ncbi:hypothetical protein J4E80_009771 [Alternaria sp. BMP 0032]|nr:hypothetical protein J4E80_009771 [Alternaria sp. BMP 0032]